MTDKQRGGDGGVTHPAERACQAEDFPGGSAAFADPDDAEDMPELQGPMTNACSKSACRIQTCLKESNFDRQACTWAIEALRRCCRKVGQHSVHCAFNRGDDG